MGELTHVKLQDWQIKQLEGIDTDYLLRQSNKDLAKTRDLLSEWIDYDDTTHGGLLWADISIAKISLILHYRQRQNRISQRS